MKKKIEGHTHTHTHELFLNSRRTQSREEKRTGFPPPPSIDNMSIKNMILKYYKEIRRYGRDAHTPHTHTHTHTEKLLLYHFTRVTYFFFCRFF
jgi:hypothetical protein